MIKWLRKMLRGNGYRQLALSIETASPGDVLILRTERRLSDKEIESLQRTYEVALAMRDIRVMLIEPPFEVRVLKLNQQGDEAKKDANNPLPFA